MIPLFADLTPTWSDKEVLIAVGKAVGATVAALVAVAGFMVPAMTAGTRRRNRDLEQENHDLRARLVGSADGSLVQQLRGQIAVMTVELEDARGKVTAAEHGAAAATAEATQLRKQCDGLRQVIDGLTAERDTVVAERDDARSELTQKRNVIRKAVERDGITWTDKVLQNRFVEFRELEPEGRRTPIISLLNLKGGVGKTTATANLGAALAHLGYRVLFVDLDLQGSLSGLFLKDHQLEPLYAGHKLVGDFLESSFDAEFPNLLDYAQPVDLPGRSMLVPTTDTLAYAEMNLNVRWFLRDTTRDPRFLLRKELQLKRITDRFDVVLIDCPPLINVSCVNALVASDYVLVPVMPSKQSTDRVTVLLQRLKEFRDNLHPSLNVLGVFANRTNQHAPTLTTDETNRLSALRDSCLDVWGVSVPVFETYIKQSIEVREVEDALRPLGPDDDVFRTFVNLAREVESLLPMFCRPVRPAATPTGAPA